MVEFATFRLDPDRRLLFERGRAIVLAPKVFDVLAYLVRNYGRVVSREELNETLWNGESLGAANIPQHVLLLRRALGDVRKPHTFVRAVHGKGYAFLREPRPAGVTELNGSRSLTPLQLYTSARFLCEQRTEPAVRAALALYDAAIEATPWDDKLHAGKAAAHVLMASYLYAAPREQMRLARVSLRRALELDARNADALLTDATLALLVEFDPYRCLEMLKRVERIRPEAQALHQMRTQCFAVQGRFVEALKAAHDGIAYHPASPAMNTLAGYALYAGGRYAESAAHLRNVMDLDPEARNAAYFYAMSRFKLGDAQGAVETLRSLLAQKAANVRAQPDVLQHAAAALAFILNDTGKTHEARAVREQLAAFSRGGVVASSHRAIACAGIDEEATAAALNRAVEQLDPWAVFAPLTHFFDAYAKREWYIAIQRTLRTPRPL